MSDECKCLFYRGDVVIVGWRVVLLAGEQLSKLGYLGGDGSSRAQMACCWRGRNQSACPISRRSVGSRGLTDLDVQSSHVAQDSARFEHCRQNVSAFATRLVLEEDSPFSAPVRKATLKPWLFPKGISATSSQRNGRIRNASQEALAGRSGDCDADSIPLGRSELLAVESKGVMCSRHSALAQEVRQGGKTIARERIGDARLGG